LIRRIKDPIGLTSARIGEGDRPWSAWKLQSANKLNLNTAIGVSDVSLEPLFEFFGAAIIIMPEYAELQNQIKRG
jgi:hypothetical protein